MRISRRIVASLACVAACQAVHADRSRLGEDSDSLDTGDCEVETAFAHTTARGTAADRASSLQVNCGIGWRTELAAAFARSRTGRPQPAAMRRTPSGLQAGCPSPATCERAGARSARARPSEGVKELGSDPSFAWEAARVQAFGVEGKTSLRDRGLAQLGWSLAYGVGAERGAGSTWRRTGQFIVLEASRQFDSAWLLDGKFGTARDRESRSNSTVWGLGVEHALTETVELRLELSGDDRRRPLWGTGLRYSIWPDRALLSLSYGLRTGPIRERQLSLAVTFEF